MFDLQILAFQADITRVITFQLTREQSNRTYPEIGVADPHHPTSHHGNDPVKVAKIAKINTYHVSLFSDFLQRMKATPDGDGSLLDHSVYLYGSGMGNPSLHDHENLPILVAGGAATGLKGDRHIRYEKGTNLANLHLTLLDRVGIHMDSFVDSTGKIEDLFDQSTWDRLTHMQWRTIILILLTAGLGAAASVTPGRSPTPRNNATIRESGRFSGRAWTSTPPRWMAPRRCTGLRITTMARPLHCW